MRRIGQGILPFAVAVVVLAHLVAGLYLVTAGPLVDFYPYYAAGALARAELDFYEPDVERWPALAAQAGIRPPTPDEPPRFLYPPFAAVLFEPLAALPEQPARAVWYGLNLVLLGAIAWRLAEWRGLRPFSTAWCLVVLATLLFGPVLLTLFLAQVNIVVAWLVVEAMIRADRRQDGAAGALLGVAAGIKLFPLALVAYLAWRGRWRAALGAVAALLATLAIGGLVLGPTPTLVFAQDFFGSHGEKLPGLPFNQSLLAVAAIVFPTASSAVWTGIAALLGGVVALVTAWAGRAAGRWDPARELSLALLATLLMVPISWIHYQVLLLPVLAAQWFPAKSSGSPARADRVIAAVGYGLPTVYVAAWPLRHVLPEVVATIVYALGAVTLLLLWGYAAWTGGH